MINAFNFSRVPRIIFGEGKVQLLPDLLKKTGDNILIVTGKSSFASSENGSRLFSSLREKKIRYRVVHIDQEPSPIIIDRVCNEFRNYTVNGVAAIGGGSVLDAGKAISAMLTVEGQVKNYLEGVGDREHPGTRLPLFAVPTTSGTGSEATKNAVISEVGPAGYKRSLRHESFVPDTAIIDPLLTVSCPADMTAASGMDCYTQLVEAYLSDKADPYSEALALEGIKAVITSLQPAWHDGTNITARSGMAFAALTSGICLANAGLGVVHGFASSIGGRYNIPHGVICGTLMAVANEVNVRKLLHGEGDSGTIRKYAVLGKLVDGTEGRSDGYYAGRFIDHLHHLTSTLKLPGLKDSGLDVSSIESICLTTENKNNPVKLTTGEMEEILNRRMHNN